MSERDEVYLRRIQSTWRSRQESAGTMTLLLGLATFGVVVWFVSAPDRQTASIMACLMVLLVLSCIRLISSAAKVVEISQILQPARFRPDVIDAEVIDSVDARG